MVRWISALGYLVLALPLVAGDLEVPDGVHDASHLGGCGAWTPAQWEPVWGFGWFPPQTNPPCPYPGQVNDFGPPSGVWETVSLGPDVEAVYLQGVNIVTHQDPAAGGLCGFQLYVRPAGNPAEWQACQVIETVPGGGQRSGCGTWVATPGGEFEVMWRRSGTALCAMMTVLRLQAVVR